MSAKHRPNPKTRETIYRVYHVPDSLRKVINQKRAKWGETVQEFLTGAVERELPRLAQRLGELGISSSDLAARPAKWPLDEKVLGKLKKASEDTGLPQTSLLLACLRLSVRRKRRPAARRE
jgi:hypothetical protein